MEGLWGRAQPRTHVPWAEVQAAAQARGRVLVGGGWNADVPARGRGGGSAMETPGQGAPFLSLKARIELGRACLTPCSGSEFLQY